MTYSTAIQKWVISLLLLQILTATITHAFVTPSPRLLVHSACLQPLKASSGSSSESGYARKSIIDEAPKKKKPLYPNAGDIVRYYDIDGGRVDGEVLVGKISFLQKNLGKEDSWLVELTELENVGDGYYAEYSSRQRQSKKTTRPLEDVAPVMASFVRAENAFKVPRNLATGVVLARAESYDIEGYPGPFAGENAVNEEVVQEDAERYSILKNSLIRNAAIAGVVGTLIADLSKGTQDAIIYAAGAAAGVGYLFFLSVKTDTMGSENAKLGGNVSNLRFVLPVLVVVGVALYNQSLGDANPVPSGNTFDTITTEQFAAAVIGFLTYRIPLFAGRIKDFIGTLDDEDILVPGSIGVAMKMGEDTSEEKGALTSAEDLIPVLLVSGPAATGRSSLVEKLISEGDGRFVVPKLMDRNKEGATFERLEKREEFLEIDPAGRFGLTKDGIMNAVDRSDDDKETVVVVDADVELAKKLTKLAGARLIGVWVGLDSVEKFESRLEAQVESGELVIPADDTKESVIRAKIKEIVRDIEFGIVSGIFEFTILNDDPVSSLKQLKMAAEYCFK